MLELNYGASGRFVRVRLQQIGGVLWQIDVIREKWRIALNRKRTNYGSRTAANKAVTLIIGSKPKRW